MKIEERTELQAVLQQLNKRFDQVDERFKQVDKRFDQMDERFKQVDKRFDQMDERFKQVDERFEHVDVRLDHQERMTQQLINITGKTNVLVEETKQEMHEMRAQTDKRFSRIEQHLRLIEVDNDYLNQKVAINEKETHRLKALVSV